MMKPRILVLPGDGVGPEVVDASLAVLEAARVDADIVRHPVGRAAIAECGVPLSDEALKVAKEAAGVLFGSVGDDPRVEPPAGPKPEQALFDLRRELAVYANLRPIRPHPALADRTPMRPDVLDGVDILVVRELNGGLYYGKKGRTADGAFDTMDYTAEQIRRIVRYGFEQAQARRRKLCSVDKANVLETSALWREIVRETAAEFPDVEVEHLYVDNAALQLLLRPASFDVIVTENTFGDILSDEGAVFTGSLGMLPSASLGLSGGGFYEPVHGTAPDIAGKGWANPSGMILSAALLVRHALGDEATAAAIEQAVDAAIASGARTRDLGGEMGSEDFTRAVVERLEA